ncbi:diacylglycerol/lipid kinase family protein [Spirochaetota bacterium]
MNEKREWLFIVNPVAGNGYSMKLSKTIPAILKQYNTKGHLVYTESKGHATELAAKGIADGFKNIAAVGGDGTISEVTQAIIGHDGITLGAIAAGTGNDFIQILGFTDHFTEEDWKIFFQYNIIPMDVGKCNDKYFINGMGLGFDAQVASENYNDGEKVKGGSKYKYIWHIIKTLFLYREEEVNINGKDKNGTYKCLLNTIANGRRFAGDYYLTPRAIANDGLIDVCMIDESKLLGRIKILLKLPKGEHLDDEPVHYYQTDKLKLEFNEEVPYHIDGELFFASSYDISVLSGKMPIVYNPKGNHYFKK